MHDYIYEGLGEAVVDEQGKALMEHLSALLVYTNHTSNKSGL